MVSDLSDGDLTIQVRGEPGLLRLDWKGASNETDPGKSLVPFFALVLADAVKAKCRVQLHFENLSYFNSATVSTLLKWLPEVRASNVRLAIIYDGQRSWQKVTFEAFRIFERSDGLLTLQDTRVDTGRPIP